MKEINYCAQLYLLHLDLQFKAAIWKTYAFEKAVSMDIYNLNDKTNISKFLNLSINSTPLNRFLN